jgi:hypothetical protein
MRLTAFVVRRMALGEAARFVGLASLAKGIAVGGCRFHISGVQ